MNKIINIPEYKVSQFNKLFKDIIESNFNYVRIKGEISEIKVATKGQLYLTLKDNSSILSGVIWDMKKKYLDFQPEQGMEVVVTGKITTWSRFKTTYQIDIDKVELAGEGALLKLIEQRKKKLESLGIFKEIHKKPLPFLPQLIGVITSPTGSVIYDIINRIKERFPINIDIWPVSVQGSNASDTIIRAIKGFNDENYISKPDLIIIARGGGSTEDLMAFNDEKLALAVFDSKIPIISAIGHETDTTIIDYVSDLRASTPTAAAEKAVPLFKELKQSTNHLSKRLNYFVNNYYLDIHKQISNISRLLKAPNIILEAYKEKILLVFSKIRTETINLYNKKYDKLYNYSQFLRSPNHNIKNQISQFTNITNTLEKNINNKLSYEIKELNKVERLLKSNSLHVTLNKGYSIVRKSKKIIKRSHMLSNEDFINIQFIDKSLNLKIKKI